MALAVTLFSAGCLPVRKQDALCCPDFPSSRSLGKTIEWPAGAKIRINSLKTLIAKEFRVSYSDFKVGFDRQNANKHRVHRVKR